MFSYDSTQSPVFPFHDSCLIVLCRALFGHEDVSELDKDILYAALWQLNGENDWRGSLKVDYGGIMGMEQTWECIPGEEVRFAAAFCVCP
jgi:hypothetical protein